MVRLRGGAVASRPVATPDFVLALREKIGHDPLWLTGVTAVVLRDRQVLLVRRSDNGEWTPVTGIVDPGEQPAAAAVREVLEEANVVASADLVTTFYAAWSGDDLASHRRASVALGGGDGDRHGDGGAGGDVMVEHEALIVAHHVSGQRHHRV